MPGQPLSLANLTDVGQALYGRGWQAALARDLHLPARTVKGWCGGKALPDLRQRLIELCLQHEPFSPELEAIIQKLQKLGLPDNSVPP